MGLTFDDFEEEKPQDNKPWQPTEVSCNESGECSGVSCSTFMTYCDPDIWSCFDGKNVLRRFCGAYTYCIKREGTTVEHQVTPFCNQGLKYDVRSGFCVEEHICK